MTATGFGLFDTAIGHCGVAWGDRGIAGVQRPEADAQPARARMQQRFPAAGASMPPPEIRLALDRMVPAPWRREVAAQRDRRL